MDGYASNTDYRIFLLTANVSKCSLFERADSLAGLHIKMPVPGDPATPRLLLLAENSSSQEEFDVSLSPTSLRSSLNFSCS